VQHVDQALVVAFCVVVLHAEVDVQLLHLLRDELRPRTRDRESVYCALYLLGEFRIHAPEPLPDSRILAELKSTPERAMDAVRVCP